MTTPPKPEPRTRGAETRARILAAAQRGLIEGGPAAFSLRAVAARAGVSLSNLQFHYGDQAALLTALLEAELAQGHALVNAALLDGYQLDDAPLRAIRALLSQQLDTDAMRLYLSLWSLAGTHAALSKILAAFYARFVDEIVAFLRLRGASEAKEDLRRRVAVAVALLEGLALFRSGVAGELPGGHEPLVEAIILSLLEPQPRSSRGKHGRARARGGARDGTTPTKARARR